MSTEARLSGFGSESVECSACSLPGVVWMCVCAAKMWLNCGQETPLTYRILSAAQKCIG